jgi:AraC-like DNA-binding protein
VYREHPSRIPGVVAWQRIAPPGAPAARILPDGCLDLIWRDGELLIAGPDRTAQVMFPTAGAVFTALRFPPGVGPAVFGVPADVLRDQRVPLSEVWTPTRARRAAATISGAADRITALEELAAERLASSPPDPVSRAVAARLRAGTPVAVIAAEFALSERQLLRRSTAAFGYGPKVLARILRMQRALALARSAPSAAVAVAAGYADQAHLSREVRALAGVTWGDLLRREQVDAVAVRVAHHGVALPPERVERLQFAGVPGPGQVGEDGVHLGRRLAPEGQRGPGTTGRRGPVRVEAADRPDGVPRESQPAGQRHLDVRLPVGLGRQVQPEQAVERQGLRHVGDHDSEQINGRCHAGDATAAGRPSS